MVSRRDEPREKRETEDSRDPRIRARSSPLSNCPKTWRDGQEWIVEGGEPSDDPADVKKWHDKLLALSAQIPAADHEHMGAAVAEQDRQAKERMRQDRLGDPIFVNLAQASASVSNPCLP